MILPIYLYGQSVLRTKAKTIEDINALDSLVLDMFDTMYKADGVGLAAPQIGKSLRLFVIDTFKISKNPQNQLKEVFYNPNILEEKGKEWDYEEGCLSIPDVKALVIRKPEITIAYTNKTGEPQQRTFKGIIARVIQHEYDHLEGTLFIDKISPLARKLLQSKIQRIKNKKLNCTYKYL